ncbi:MAG: DUF2950 domain-containing protein [Rhodanobacteraceae bacterium]
MTLASNARRRAAFAACAGIIFSAAVLAAPSNYPSADAAASALVDAVRAGDEAALAKVLGADWKTIIPSDGVDDDDVAAFLAAYQSKHQIVARDNASVLEVGNAGWTLPIPIVKSGEGYTFDLKAGHDEMIARQIGRNELDTEQAILAFYDAERDYALEDRNGDGVLEYAQKFISTSGKQDGLYWDVKEGAPESPLGPLFARGTPKGGGEGYHGYHYRILTAQGASAPGGAYNYRVGGRMRGGFAAIAWPVTYGVTGVMSFMVSHDGVVFEKDLGKNGGGVAQSMKTFDPDSSWRVDDDLGP